MGGARGEGVGAKQQAFRLTPLLAALLLAYPAMQARHAQAEDATANTLPDLGNAGERPGSLTPKPNGVTLDNRSDGKRLVVSPEYSDQTGLSMGGIFAFPFGDSAAAGLVFTAGDRKNELLLNAGFQMDDAQRLILTLGQQRQHLDIGFISGSEKAAMTQTSAAASYQFRLEQGSLNGAEINAYIADTPSRDLADKSYALDTATLYESWNDPRRVAGGRVTGLQARLAFTPMPGGIFKLGLGGEKQEYDYLAGKQSTTHGTGSAEWSQQLESGYQLNAGADAAVQNRYTLGLSRPFGDGWLFGINFVGIRSRDGAPDDNQIKLTWSYNFGGKRTTSGNGGSTAPAWGSLLDQVARHPGFLPAQVVARLDTTAAPARLIAVDKNALPAGSSVNPTTGAVTTPLGVTITGIIGVTLNGAPFGNSGQFSLSGNSLAIYPNQITQPAVGVVDTYVVTLNNAGGGTTLVTVLVSHGSVKIDSITISNGDTTAPTTTGAPAVSGTTDTATTLTVTLDESGTGYYLVQAATATAPSVAALQAGGTAFAITANVAATQNISGLAALTAYKIYFVAQDAANNMQAAVQSVDLTTTAAPDTIPPVAAADSATTPFNTAKTGIDVLANDTDNSGAAPTLTGVLANPVGGSFAVNAGKIDFTPASGFSGAASVTYEIRDGRNNKATEILTVTVEKDTPPPPPPPSDTTAPVATADSTATPYNTAKTGIDVLANDTDNSGAAPALTGVLSNPLGGTFAANAGKIDFTPAPGFSGAASVSYEIADGSNNKAAGVLTVTVGTDTTAPIAAADSAATPFNTAKTGIDVLANDTDNSGVAPALTGVLVNPVGGTFAANAGKIDFTPAQGFLGAASATYEIWDGSGNKATGVLTVMVGADPSIPVAVADSAATPFNTAKTGIDVLANDTNSGGPAPALTGVLSNPVGGTFAVNAGKIDFTPTNGFSGAASVSYEIIDTDGSNNKATGVLTVMVGADPSIPVAVADSAVTPFNTAKTGIDVLANDTNSGGAAPALTGVLSNPVGGTFAVNAGKIDFTTTNGFSGAASVSYEIIDTDGSNNKATGVLTVTVGAYVPPPPPPPPADTTAPTTSAGPSVSGTTDTATTLSVTINENGTGYYLVQAFAAAAPNVAAVQAGTSFAMTVNVAATPAIGGLTAATAYKIYFVAKDAANNVQAAVQSVAVTTTATPDTTPPVTSSAPAISVAATDTAASVTQTINENGTGYYLVLPAADAIPTVAAVKAGTSFAMTANTPAAVSLTGLTPSTAYKYYFVAKDAANNDQAAVSAGLAITTTATPDTTAPTTSAGPSVSGTTSTGTTLSVTLDENGTGYYLVQTFAAAAPNVAAVQAGTSFAMTANVAATPAIGGLTAGTAYKIYFVAKDVANNVQAAVQSVAVTTNTAPTANNFTYGTNIDNTAKTFDWKVLSAAADADGDALTAAVQAQGAKGSFVVAGDNVTYTANANQTGSDSGTLRISDGRGVKDITVTVNGIDTAPPAAPVLVASWAGYPADVTFNNAGGGTLSTPPDADLAAWFVSESSSAPAAGAAGWNGAKPTTYTFPAPPGSGGTATVCVYVKDTLGNVQQTGACESYLVP